MTDPNANPTENSTDAEFVITQEMIDIARESITVEEDCPLPAASQEWIAPVKYYLGARRINRHPHWTG